jgi:uncharacterized RDD family membrane protein YckC
MTAVSEPTGIVTPEAVVLEFDAAGAGSRLISESIDVTIQLVAFGLLLLGAVLLAAGLSSSGLEWIAVVLVFVFLFLVLFGYPIACETLWNGKTPGKAAMGLRVVTEEGGPIRFRHAAIRGILTIVDVWGLFILWGVPGLLTIILSRKNQRFGDMLAGTIVLRERGAGGTAMAMSFPPPPGYEHYVASLDVSSITTEQYGVIRSFLMRVRELTPGARAALAVRLANPVAVQLNHTPPPMVNPELFLVCVASAYQQRGGAQWSPTWNPSYR